MLNYAVKNFCDNGLTYDRLVDMAINSDPLLKEKLVCDFLGIAQNTLNNGADGFDFKRMKVAEIKTQRYSDVSSIPSKLSGSLSYSSPSMEIYKKKKYWDEDTYYAGFVGSELAVIIRTTFSAFSDEFLEALIEKGGEMKMYAPTYMAYKDFPETKIIFKSEKIAELKDYFTEPFYDWIMGVTPVMKLRKRVLQAYKGEAFLMMKDDETFGSKDKVTLMFSNGDKKEVSISSINSKFNKGEK